MAQVISKNGQNRGSGSGLGRKKGKTGEEEDWGKKKIEKQEVVGLHTLPSREPPNTNTQNLLSRSL
ncbi:hypothetical protein Taro_035036, partial [Colocasia esculenta]|nr:hypothetical protein [Colocasia esculenta]